MTYYGRRTRGARDREIMALFRLEFQRWYEATPGGGLASARKAITVIHTAALYVDGMRERYGMPRRNQKNADWKGFVDYRLTGDDKAAYAAWDANSDDVFEVLVHAIETGHKLSVAYNSQAASFSASFTGNASTGPNAGLTLSAFGPDWVTACRVLCFKHSELAGCDWSALRGLEADEIG